MVRVSEDKMGKIFYVMGKSATGKDTVYKALKERFPEFGRVVMYTTRPIREGERDGVEYFFTTPERWMEFKNAGKVIEERTYQTIYGPWTYFTADDGQIQLGEKQYLMIGTLESYRNMVQYFGAEAICPLYIQIDDGIRLERALKREKEQKVPKYKELCRRFLADEEDFSEEKLKEAGIVKRYYNGELTACIDEIAKDILEEEGKL